MHQTNFVPEIFPEGCGAFLRGGEIEFFRFFDERADPIGARSPRAAARRKCATTSLDALPMIPSRVSTGLRPGGSPTMRETSISP